MGATTPHPHSWGPSLRAPSTHQLHIKLQAHGQVERRKTAGRGLPMRGSGMRASAGVPRALASAVRGDQPAAKEASHGLSSNGAHDGAAAQQQQQPALNGASNGVALGPSLAPAESDFGAARVPVPSHRTPPPPASLLVKGTSVTVRSMHKHYLTKRGTFRAVDGVDLDIEPGKLTALLGPSGSGKTTLLRLIAGLEQPTSGQVFFDGTDMTPVSVQQRDIGFTFQGYALFRYMTVADNIAFGPTVRRLKIDIPERVNELLALTGLTGYDGRFPPQLSGGQRQRVALARALACSPRLLLLDEPFGALDPIVRKSVRRSLKEIVSEIGVTTVMVTHDKEEAWELADHVVLFNSGHIEQQGTMEHISDNPVSPFTMNFMGDVLHLPAESLFIRKMGVETTKPYVMLRQSDISLHADYRHPRICPATVRQRIQVGWTSKYLLVFDDGEEIEVVMSKKEDRSLYNFSTGQRVYVSAPANLMMPFELPELNDPLSEEVLLSRMT